MSVELGFSPFSLPAPGVLASVASPHVQVQKLLTDWQTDPLSLLVLAGAICLAGVYLLGVRRLAAKHRKWSSTAGTLEFPILLPPFP